MCHILEVIDQAGNQAAAEITPAKEEHGHELRAPWERRKWLTKTRSEKMKVSHAKSRFQPREHLTLAVLLEQRPQSTK